MFSMKALNQILTYRSEDTEDDDPDERESPIGDDARRGIGDVDLKDAYSRFSEYHLRTRTPFPMPCPICGPNRFGPQLDRCAGIVLPFRRLGITHVAIEDRGMGESRAEM